MDKLHDLCESVENPWGVVFPSQRGRQASTRAGDALNVIVPTTDIQALLRQRDQRTTAGYLHTSTHRRSPP